MGKSLLSFQQVIRVSTSSSTSRLQGPSHIIRPISTAPTEPAKASGVRAGLEQQQKQRRVKNMEENSEKQKEARLPLSEVVNDCVKRWFQDTLKEAKAGDTAMQVLVGQMYCSGYGVTTDAQKGRAWINRASKTRSSALKVGDKHPGYNASDSDSDDAKEIAK